MGKAMDKDKDSPQPARQKRGGGIKRILDEAAEKLGNPLVLIDLSYNLLAHTENRVDDDPVWNELITLGKFSHQTVHFFQTENFIEGFANCDTVWLMKTPKLKYDRLSGVLYDKEGIQIGSICVVGCYRPFEEGDTALVEQVCERLSEEMENSEDYGDIERAFEEGLLSDLIEGKEPDPQLLEQGLKEIYSGLGKNLYLAVVEVINYEKTLTHLVYFRDLFADMQPQFKCFVYLNNVVILISTDRGGLDERRDFPAIKQFFSEHKIYAGVSAVFDNLQDLRKHYRQALTALNYGLNSGLDLNIFRYDDFRLDHFLNSQHGQVDMKEFCNPQVFLMQDYDINNDTEYLETLYVFLLYGQNCPETAQKLGISEKELQTRLANVGELFYLDWSNGLKSASLLLSLRILKCFC